MNCGSSTERLRLSRIVFVRGVGEPFSLRILLMADACGSVLVPMGFPISSRPRNRRACCMPMVFWDASGFGLEWQRMQLLLPIDSAFGTEVAWGVWAKQDSTANAAMRRAKSDLS